MSTIVGHFVSSPREREKKYRRNSSGDEREGQRRKRNRNESEETEEIKTFPLYPYLLQHDTCSRPRGRNKGMPDCPTRAVAVSGKQTLLVVGPPGMSQFQFIFVNSDSFSHQFSFFLCFRTASLIGRFCNFSPCDVSIIQSNDMIHNRFDHQTRWLQKRCFRFLTLQNRIKCLFMGQATRKEENLLTRQKKNISESTKKNREKDRFSRNGLTNLPGYSITRKII